MITLVREEIFKLVHKKSTWVESILLLILMTFFAVMSQQHPKTFDPQSQFMSAYTGVVWILLFLVAACSSIIAMEFQYGTIKEVLYRKYYRGQVLVSKWLTMLLYSVYFFVLAYAYSLILKLIFANDTFQLSETYGQSKSILETFGYQMFSQFVSVWLILSLVLLLANLFKSSSAAITVGIIGYFALSIMSGLMAMVVAKWEWLKWNPLNMMYLPSQVTDVGHTVEHMTKLSTPELYVGSLVYTAIFLAVSYLVFRKRNI